MELGPGLSLIRQTGEAGYRTRDPWIQGEWFIHYTTSAPAPMIVPIYAK